MTNQDKDRIDNFDAAFCNLERIANSLETIADCLEELTQCISHSSINGDCSSLLVTDTSRD